MLGDTDYSDTSYTGAPDTSAQSSALTLDYYRNKAREFQDTLNAVAQGMAAAQYAIDTEAVDSDTMLDLYNMIQEADSKRMLFRLTAEAINAGAAVVNAAGGRFPELSIPAGLGVLPVIPLAAIAAIATAATLIAWGTTWLHGLNDRLRLAEQLGAVTDPDKKAALAQSIAMSDAASQAAQSSPLASIASLVKWGAIGVAAFMVYRAYQARS